MENDATTLGQVTLFGWRIGTVKSKIKGVRGEISKICIQQRQKSTSTPTIIKNVTEKRKPTGSSKNKAEMCGFARQTNRSKKKFGNS